MPRTLGVTDAAARAASRPGRHRGGTASSRCASGAYRCSTSALRQWFLATNRGIPQEEIEGHQTTSGIATARLTQALREEGGDEILALTDARGVIRPRRRFVYSVRISTTYGRDMDLREDDQPVTYRRGKDDGVASCRQEWR